MLKNKNILLGVTGGIAAYKAVELASRLIKEGANVKVILTGNAQEFITPLTFRSITNQSVVTRLFNSEAPIEHISLAEWSDIVVIAPATANIIGKVAGGIADDLLSTTIMAATSPKLFVPAMNSFMWDNSIVQENIDKLEHYGYIFVPPDTGRLACGYEGKGRFPDISEIIYFIKSALYYQIDLTSQKVLVTAGACREYLDPMRYISNESSGKMGLALARAAYHRGADVTLITGHISEAAPYYIDTHTASSSKEMYDLTLRYAKEMNMIIMTAAVTDFQPLKKEVDKIKKEKLNASGLNLKLIPTDDILKKLGSSKSSSQTLVGFAAETTNIVVNARKKMLTKKCDFMIANNINTAGKDDTQLIILEEDKETEVVGDKFFVAHQIWDKIK
ncbi:MAG: bifunctional phosphopantothenoylcysteine decarboxylase/phosphopantothenate--cysteine ligase CoaBC [Candidatus Cloacimonetes bacterium]|nr:bifunctional phosphopantothenoylcysteine decarboxylase/phosphopantothenate--cysteine ligase CoaBC [Candidatus Cloacimonadota bacterium]